MNYRRPPQVPASSAQREDRGDVNKWERITWDEALDTIADWIHTNIDDAGFGRESIFVNHGTGRNIIVPGCRSLGGACLGTAEHRCHRVVGLLVLPAAHVRHGRERSATSPSWTRRKGHEDRYVNRRMGAPGRAWWCGAASR